MQTLLEMRFETLRRLAAAAGKPETDEVWVLAPEGVTDDACRDCIDLDFRFDWAEHAIPGWMVDAARFDPEWWRRLLGWATAERMVWERKRVEELKAVFKSPAMWRAPR